MVHKNILFPDGSVSIAETGKHNDYPEGNISYALHAAENNYINLYLIF